MARHVLAQVDISDAGTIADRIEADGVVIVPEYLEESQASRAARECYRLFRDPPRWAHPEEYSLGRSVRMERADVNRAEFPSILAALEHPGLEAIADRVFGPGYIFSRTIYAIHDVVGSRTRVQQLHYDKMRHLKSFVYLSDVGVENGPFHCVPGSHRLTRRIEERNRGNRVIPTDDDARCLPPDLHRDVVPVVGEAGTLIIFDSDIAHHAGVVERGSRLAIRSLSFGSYRRERWYRTDGALEVPP
jgi:hypothetical protein